MRSAPLLRCASFVLAALVALGIGAGAADAGSARYKSKHSKVERGDPDCVPINGRNGYYGNPWCDTGSYRLPDIELRQRRAAERRRWKSTH